MPKVVVYLTILMISSMVHMSSEFLFFSFLIFVAHYSLNIHVEASHHVMIYKTPHNHPSLINQTYRTGYHFQPPKNWINDPNGPMIYKGVYHMFYQYNPRGAVWGNNIVWAHSTSTDLVNWTAHKPAIYPSQPSDIKGAWSGSATIIPPGKPAIMYTGVDPQGKQVQNLAVPKDLSDPFLTKWIKSPKNPLMVPTPQNGINASSFRDPTTAWFGPDGNWRVAVGSKLERQGRAILYRSKDFVNWELAETPLHSANDNGMWECPDFFPVLTDGTSLGSDTSRLGPDVKHVLKVSLDDTKYDYYTIGTYDINKDIYVPDNGSVESDVLGLRYDYGKFYASKTFFDDAKKRRILWGWVNESSLPEADIQKGWAGIQAIPRTVWLDKSGKQLVQWPVVEIEKLRSLKDQVKWQDKVFNGGSKLEVSGVLTPAQADIEITFNLANVVEKAELWNPEWTNPREVCRLNGESVRGSLGPFGLLALASDALQEYTSVFFRVFKGDDDRYVVLMCSDLTRSSLDLKNDRPVYGSFVDVDPAHEKVSLRSLIDHSVVESFGGQGKSCITARVYPTLAINSTARLFVFNNGTQTVNITQLNAWSMNTAKIN